MAACSVVIAAWNAADVLEPCLDSLGRQALEGGIEVIVVDDGSTDRTPALLESRRESVTAVRNEEPTGYCAAINRGAELARSEVVLVCNSDVEFSQPDSVQALAEALRDSGVGLVTPRYSRPDGSLQPSCARFPGALGALVLGLGLHHLMPDRLRATLAPHHWSHSESRDVDWAMGAVIGIRTDLWRELGGYWPLMYGSETDLAWRARLRGHRTRFVRESAVMHVGNFSNRQRWSGPEREARVALSELAFLQTHYPALRRGLIRAIVACTYAARVPILRLLGRTERAREYSAMARVYASGAAASD